VCCRSSGSSFVECDSCVRKKLIGAVQGLLLLQQNICETTQGDAIGVAV
jgi:hypothetical protein